MGPNSFWIRNVTFIHFHEILNIFSHFILSIKISRKILRLLWFDFKTALTPLCTDYKTFYWPISDLLLPFNFEKFRQLLAYHMGSHFDHKWCPILWPKNWTKFMFIALLENEYIYQLHTYVVFNSRFDFNTAGMKRWKFW